jgi:uncharacterized protein YbbK (DUF523 family)
MLRILISACLLGEKVRYNGADATCADQILSRWLAAGRVVPFCPEVAGGLGVPRPAAEIIAGGGVDVLDGTSRIRTAAGADVTDAFLRGAQLALARAREESVTLAVLKDGSPSCATRFVHDGTFTGMRRGGQGVTAALLERHGIRVFSEGQLAEAEVYVRGVEERELHQARNGSRR